jgi:hypothetical protein
MRAAGGRYGTEWQNDLQKELRKCAKSDEDANEEEIPVCKRERLWRAVEAFSMEMMEITKDNW